MVFICLSCQKSSIVKPDKLIDEDKMVDIIYDFSLLRSHQGGKSGIPAKQTKSIRTNMFIKNIK